MIHLYATPFASSLQLFSLHRVTRHPVSDIFWLHHGPPCVLHAVACCFQAAVPNALGVYATTSASLALALLAHTPRVQLGVYNVSASLAFRTRTGQA